MSRETAAIAALGMRFIALLLDDVMLIIFWQPFSILFGRKQTTTSVRWFLKQCLAHHNQAVAEEGERIIILRIFIVSLSILGE